MTKWQDMHAAPRDGTVILVVLKTVDLGDMPFWWTLSETKTGNFPSVSPVCVARWYDGAWVTPATGVGWDDSLEQLPVEPLLWLPAPEAPV